jgi:hypothetical protein
MRDQVQITIGSRWSFFTYERADMQLLGVVQRGMEIGALAKLPDGTYAKVNGDTVEPLNTSRIEFALRKATGTRRGEPIVNVPRTTTATVVTVKKRRRVVLSPLPAKP